MNDNDHGPEALDRAAYLFKRGFEVTDSISPGHEVDGRAKRVRCRSCDHKFIPTHRSFGQHICPRCNGRQEAS